MGVDGYTHSKLPGGPLLFAQVSPRRAVVRVLILARFVHALAVELGDIIIVNADYMQAPFALDEAQVFKQLQAVLQPILLRRTKETKDKNGNVIVTLPSRSDSFINGQD